MRAYVVNQPTLDRRWNDILVIAKDMEEAGKMCPNSKRIRELEFKVILIGDQSNES